MNYKERYEPVTEDGETNPEKQNLKKEFNQIPTLPYPSRQETRRGLAPVYPDQLQESDN